MKAVLWTGYGAPGRLEVADVDVPTPADDEVRIQIHATTVSAGDCEVRSLRIRFPLSILLRLYFGAFRPKRVRILGQELSGVVDALGRNVRAFGVGDEVFAQTDFTMGAYAEYRCFPAVPGERVLIIGAGGSIGTVAIQIAKHYECHVTGVDRGD